MPVFGRIKRYTAPEPRITGDIDMSGIHRLSSILEKTKIRNKKVEQENNTLGVLKTKNELRAKSDEIFNKADETGDYSTMMEDWDSVVESTQQESPQGMNEFGKQYRDLILKQQHLITKDKIADYQTTKRAEDIATQAGEGLKELVNNAIRDTTSLPAADSEIDAMIDAIPGLSQTKKESIIKSYKSQLTNNTINQMIKEDPNIFLKNVSVFENRLTKNELNIKKKEARAALSAIRAANKKAMSEEQVIYKSMIPDQVSSMTTTGVPVDPNLVTNLRNTGATKEAIELIKSEDLALKVFDFNSKTIDMPFDEKLEEAQKIRPVPGDINSDKKQAQYDAIEKKIREDYTEYLQDPIKYLNLEVREYKGDANIFSVRAASQLKMGTKPSQIQLFSESEKALFQDTWNSNQANRAENLTTLLSTVPSNLQDHALNSLNIESDYKTAYRMSENSQSRKNIMFAALNKKTFELLTRSEKQEILEDTVKFSNLDNNYLKYYTQLANITGDANSLELASDSLSLFSKMSSYFKEKGYEDNSQQSADLIFGPNITVIANDIGIGIDTQATPFDQEVQNNLELYLQNEMELSDLDNNTYNSISFEKLKNDSGIFIQQKDGFILYNKSTRNKVTGNDGKPIVLTYGDLTKMRKEFYEETITTRMGL